MGVHVLDGLLTGNVRGGVGEVANLIQQVSGNPNIEHQVHVDEVCVYLHEELFSDDGAYETTGEVRVRFGDGGRGDLTDPRMEATKRNVSSRAARTKNTRSPELRPGEPSLPVSILDQNR